MTTNFCIGLKTVKKFLTKRNTAKLTRNYSQETRKNNFLTTVLNFCLIYVRWTQDRSTMNAFIFGMISVNTSR